MARVLQEFEDHRSRVKDDAFELIVAVKIVEPLLTGNMETGVPTFLRRILSRYAILSVTRLMAPIGTGRTGTTASLRSLLHLAGESCILPVDFIGSINVKIAKLETEFERDGFTLKDLNHLRHTQIAHTLIAHEGANQVWMHAVIEAAEDLFEISTEIESALVDAGCSPLIDNSAAPETWRVKSSEFWSENTRAV